MFFFFYFCYLKYVDFEIVYKVEKFFNVYLLICKLKCYYRINVIWKGVYVLNVCYKFLLILF